MRLTVERLGHLGDGIAAGPDGPVYIPRVLPGEVVEGDVAAGVMALPKIVMPSPDRVRPPCIHYRTCGGCSLQHASDGFVAAWKQQVVHTALTAQGLTTVFRPAATSPPQSRRRAVLAGRRTRAGALVGFHAKASDTLVPVPGCAILHPDLVAAIPLLETITALAGSRQGEIAFTATRSGAGLDLAVAGGTSPDAGLRMVLAGLAGQHRVARLTWDGETVALGAPPAQHFGAALVTPPPGAFLQATAPGEAALRAAVLAIAGSADRIADLFAGCGTFALPLAATAEVHAVEADAAMIAALDAGWRQARGLKRVTTETRDLFRRPLLAAELGRFGAVVIDPPRAGAQAQMAELARSTVPAIAAVSCNPVTFARDARLLLAGGYRLDTVQVVDQFRWSPHVELVAAFLRG